MARMTTETACLRSLALCGGLLALTLGAALPAAAQTAPKDQDAVRKAMSGIWSGYNERPAGQAAAAPAAPVSTVNDRRFPPALEAIMLPWVRSGYDKYKHAAANVVDKEPPTPDNQCLPFAMPGEGPSSSGLQILFTPKVTGMIIHLDTQFRLIHMDQEHPKTLKPSWHGHSVGHWEGDTLVVDTIGYDERSDFSDGVLHSAKLHAVERYHMTADGHLQMDVTYDDPGAFTKPYTITKKWKRDEPFQEYLNAQNNRLYPCPTAEGGSLYKPFR